MSIKVNVKRKFTINGKEYNSIDEMPGDVRSAVEKAMESRGGLEGLTHSAQAGKVVFNGTEYEGIDSMPEDIRQVYHSALKAASAKIGPVDCTIPLNGASGRRGEHFQGAAKPAFEPSVNPRVLAAGAGLALLVFLLMFLFRGL